MVRILVALVALVALAGAAQAQRLRYDPHIHASGTVRGRDLVKLARDQGGLRAGLAALGLGHLPERQAVRAALKQMDLGSRNHGDAYKALGAFRRAAFAGPRYGAWVRAAVDKIQKNARQSYVQVSTPDIERFIATARAEHISLEGVGLLASAGREGRVATPALRALLRHREVAGIDIHGPETGTQDPRALDAVIDLLLGSDKPRPVLRIHAGEGYLGARGHHNVNIVLRTLVARSRATDLTRLHIIIGHAARIADLRAASRDLKTLADRGVHVEVNVNPLSNLTYGAVKDLTEIDALRLRHATLVPGSDNVGSAATNARILRTLLQEVTR